MKFIILPISDAQLIFTEDELSHVRKNNDGSQVIVHEEILIDKRTAMGMSVLSNDQGEFEWIYPTYQYNSEELNSLLQSSDWSKQDETV